MPTHECKIKNMPLRFNIPELASLNHTDITNYACAIQKLIDELEDSLKLYDTTKLAYMAAIVLYARYSRLHKEIQRPKQKPSEKRLRDILNSLTDKEQ